jgi:RHS repeat-associated protein
VKRLEYDKFEQRAFLEAGNQVRTSYTYRPDNRRLTNLKAGKGSGNLFQNLNYGYDNVGNILSLANDVAIPPPNQFGGPTNQSFGYDDLYRLTQAQGTYQFSPSKTDRYTLAMSYDSIHNIIAKQQAHEIVQPSGQPITQKKTSYVFNYAYNNSGPSSTRPHAPIHIGNRTFNYDADGNQLGWDNDDNGTRRNIIWDEENRIQSIFDNGHEKTYKYDDQGQRVIKRGPQGETVYVNQWFTIRNREVGTKHVFLGTTRAVSKLMKQDKPGSNPNGNTPIEKDLFFFHPDHLGSSHYITDTNGKLFEHLEYFAFGETWVEEATNTQRTPFLFTGKELDEETGLYYFGARYYDPRTSVWQSADPALPKYLNSRQSGGVFVSHNLGLFSYAHNNPVMYIDPDGETPYTFYIRSFAPDKSFGFGFHGDNRGFSTDTNATARIHQRFTLETDDGTLYNRATWSSPSQWILGGPETETPRGSFSSVSQDGNSFSFSTSYAGQNPLTPRCCTPDLDVSSSFGITEDKKSGILSISAAMAGDKFPSAESFVVDPSGKAVFIGVSQKGFHPVTDLPGDNARPMINSSFGIRLDKAGNFTGVIYNGKDYSIEQWNRMHSEQTP